MSDRIKILFYVSEFYQSGANRYAYEIDKSINKERFQVDILCFHPLQSNENWADHYYEKHLQLGTNIYFMEDINVVTIPSWKDRLQKKFLNRPLPKERQKLHDFLDHYSVIFVHGEYNYPSLAKYMTQEQKSRTYISLHNSIYQNRDNYIHFNKKEFYHFISCFDENQVQNELKEFDSFSHTFFPLSIQIENPYVKTEYPLTKAPKIGIFTRLSYTKPLDPFIYAFQLILDKYPMAEFHIYGTGDPEKEGVNKYIRNLGLTKHVFFRGHQENLSQTAVKDNLTLIWLHGYYGVPGGFAGFDICTTKIPQIFWDFSAQYQMEKDHRFPMTNNLKEFVDLTLHTIEHPEDAKKLAELQYQYVLDERNILRYISTLEKLFEKQIKLS